MNEIILNVSGAEFNINLPGGTVRGGLAGLGLGGPQTNADILAKPGEVSRFTLSSLLVTSSSSSFLTIGLIFLLQSSK
jgi:hypothetical protein